MRQYLFILLCALLCSLAILGCKEYDEWEWRAGSYWGKDEGYCRDRVKQLGAEMQERGVPFKVVLGDYCHEPHCWIVYEKGILEPTQTLSDPIYYKERARLDYDVFVVYGKNMGWWE